MATYTAEVLADSPVGYWHLGESAFASPATDVIGNSNGAYTNTTGLTFSQTGIIGGGSDTAVRFIRANSGHVQIPSVGANQVGDVFTYEVWVKRVSTGTLQGIVGADSLGPGMYFDGGDNWKIRSVANTDLCTATVTLTDTASFHHLVWTKNGATSKMYLDSVDVTGTVTNVTISNAFYRIGEVDASFFFDGIIDEVAIYPTALSAARVLAHYTAGTTVATQTLLASADSVDGSWTNESGGTTLTASIDETTASDSDYIQSELSPSASGCRVKLASGGDPASSSGHEINWRAGKNATGGQTVNLTVKLYQGGGNSLGGGTLIADFDRNGVDAMTDYTETLSGGEADAITDYTDLYLEFHATAT